MTVLRTPDERFANLPEFPFKPHYVEINGMRVHYLDEGQGEIILCLHGEPTWSFLYRKMIPPLSKHHRVMTMDFVGFGRSDKYPEMGDYSFQMHRDTLIGFIHELGLEDITLVVQDWGGLIGLTVASQMPEYFSRLVIMNTFLPTGEGRISKEFWGWRQFAKRFPNMPIGRVIKMGMAQGNRVTPEILSGYEAPFPDASYKAGAAVWPLLVPVKPDDPGGSEMKEARAVLSKWRKPTLVMFSDSDPIMKGGDKFFRELIPSAADQPEVVIESADHFLQEEKGEQIAQYILEFVARTPPT
ncbi:haloalkane dehalogenase [Chloroflexota bacterium]